tara:strand:+ start:41 stop:220 length:180 start_codon:yes stop_codon:yes gene_type:complete
VKPGDLVKIHFWDEPYATDLFGIIILVRDADLIYDMKWYKVWVNGILAEFTKEELQLIE